MPTVWEKPSSVSSAKNILESAYCPVHSGIGSSNCYQEGDPRPGDEEAISSATGTLAEKWYTMGRDRLHEVLRTQRMLIRHKKSVPQITHSKHLLRKYPNLIKQLSVSETEQVWVCDITYIYVGFDFNYLSLITDAYSKKIVGYCLHQFLSTEGCLIALEMALATLSKQGSRLIHHRTVDPV